MKFEGDLSKFFPPDLLIFIANLGKEGVLTIKHPFEFLTISMKKGCVTSAHSKTSDDKLLKMLYLKQQINTIDYKKITQARKETGLDVITIIEKLNLVSDNVVEDIIVQSIKEALFRFFLLTSGEFSFTDISVEDSSLDITLPAQVVAIDLSSLTDDWQEMETKLITFDRTVSPAAGKLNDENRTSEEKILLSIVQKGRTIRDLVEQAPFSSYQALKMIDNAITGKRLMLHEPEKKKVADHEAGGTQVLFSDYKTACKRILSVRHSGEKIKGLIRFCKGQFDLTCVISLTKTRIIRSFIFYKDKKNNLLSKEIKDIKYNIEEDPVFERTYSSGFAFFGKVFPAAVFQNMIPIPETGDCAVIPLGQKDDRVNLIYAVSTKTKADIGPFHYLELLSWLVNPEKDGSSESDSSISVASQKKDAGEIGEKKISLKDAVADLPPMPHLASKMLQVLSDPDSTVEDLTDIIEQDPAIMATLIKVSNSALYRTGEEISTLNNAITRLGFKTIRSLVLTATTHSLFPKNNAKLEMMSQALWQHAKECGLASRQIATFIGYHEPEEAFVAGLLHDIGKLAILLKYTESFKRISDYQRKGVSSIDAENEVLGFDHAETGGALMDKWKIPENLALCVKFHHTPDMASEYSRLAHIVSLGDCLSHIYGIYADETQTAAEKQKLNLKALKITEDDIETLREKVVEDFEQSDVFD